MTTPILDSSYNSRSQALPRTHRLNDDRGTHGVCELKLCLGNSFNIPAVKTEYATGDAIHRQHRAGHGRHVAQPELPLQRADVRELADSHPMGCDARIAHLRITLLDLADGAATLGDLGVQHNPMPVTRITSQQTGQTVFTYDPAAAGHQVIPANVAYIMDEITSNDNNRIREFGRNGYLTLGSRRVSAKTGTADFFMDNLTVGWTPTCSPPSGSGTGNAAASRTRIALIWRPR